VLATGDKEPLGQASRRPAVLIVEDEVLLRLTLADELRDAGFVVAEAVNADEALDVLQSPLAIGLMVTDVRMPGIMDGLDLVAMVREAWPDVKIIIMSGHLSGAAGVTADAFFAKPVDFTALIRRVRELYGVDE
jgi:two-component system, response regulator PdtaR